MKIYLSVILVTIILILSACIKNMPSQSSVNLVNGKVVPAGMFDEVGEMQADKSGCTATVVGPRAILTAGHCILDNDGDIFSETFTDVKDRIYQVTYYRSPNYMDGEVMLHDIMIGITDRDIEGISPATIASGFKIGDEVTLVGRGCTDLNASDGTPIDELPRYGKTTIDSVDYLGTAFVSHKNVFLCSGDSGGPAFLIGSDGYHRVIGVASTGSADLNTPENGHTRMDHEFTKTFMKNLIKETGVKLCGVNLSCNPYKPLEK